MKKLLVFIISAALVMTLAFTTFAAADLSEFEAPEWTTFSFLTENGEPNEGVRFVTNDGEEIAAEDVLGCIGQSWPNNTLSDNAGAIQFIVWSNSGHMANGTGLRQCCLYTSDDKGFAEITFKGVGIRIGTCYRTDAFGDNEMRVTIDGEEVETDPDLLHADWADDTTPTVIFEETDLENTVHTLRIYDLKGEFEYDWFQLMGTLGADGEGYVAPETTTAADTTAAEQTTNADTTEAGTTEAGTTEAATTVADTSDAGEEESSFPIWIPIVAAAVVVAAVVVAVIAKKKK